MQQLIIFEIDQKHLAVKVGDVVEIIRAVEVTAVPETDLPFVGVINYRGNIVPVVRLSHLLGLNSNLPEISEQMIIIGSTSLAQQVCLIVDQVITFTTSDQLQPVAELDTPSLQGRITPELARLETSLVPVISVPALLARSQNVIQPVLLPQDPPFSEN